MIEVLFCITFYLSWHSKESVFFLTSSAVETFILLFPEIIMKIRIFVETYAYVASDSEGVEGRRER